MQNPRGARWQDHRAPPKYNITIGSAEQNDLTLMDDTVSRHHCRIFQEGSSYVVQDQGSTNGTFVNDVRIKGAYLKPGYVIEFVNTRLQFQSSMKKCTSTSADERFGDIIGASRDMRSIFGILEKIAPSDATVVIEGETAQVGSCRQYDSQKIPTFRKPFIVFDCSAVPANLIESELFGHEKGSHAIMARPGLF